MEKAYRLGKPFYRTAQDGNTFQISLYAHMYVHKERPTYLFVCSLAHFKPSLDVIDFDKKMIID